MEDQVLTFRELIAPISPEVFFRDYYGRRALHIPGPPEKFARVFSWEGLNDLLGMSTLWTGRSLELAMDGRSIPAERYCYPSTDREGRRVTKPDLAKVRRLLRDGATLALDFVELLSPGLRSLAWTLEAVTGAQVCASAFCSWQETQGYASHFDVQNVFACHLAGSKTWRIYDGRMVNAADYPGGNRESFPQTYHEKAKGKVAQEVAMTPGDLLYIPHGLYHDALSSSEACLHVSFGTLHLVAQDFFQALMKDLTRDPVFREHLPHLDDLEAHGPYLERLGDRLREIVAQPAIARQLRDFMREQAYGRISDFHLPARQGGERFRVRWRCRRLVAAKGAGTIEGGGRRVELDAAETEIARWMAERDHFSVDRLRAAFGGAPERLDQERLDQDRLGPVLEKLQKIGFIELMG